MTYSATATWAGVQGLPPATTQAHLPVITEEKPLYTTPVAPSYYGYTSLAAEMERITAEFAQRVKQLSYVQSVWAGQRPGCLEIWTIIEQESLQQKAEENLHRYLSVGDIELHFLRHRLPFAIDFHTTPTGPDLADYIPKDFVQIT
jgi:hypothetical protein